MFSNIIIAFYESMEEEMKRITLIVLAVGFALECYSGTAVQAAYYTGMSSKQKNQVVIEKFRDVPEEYQLKPRDSPEVAFQKIEKALKSVRTGIMIRVPILLYPENSWYDLLDLLKNGGYTAIPYCEIDREVKGLEQCTPEGAFILIHR